MNTVQRSTLALLVLSLTALMGSPAQADAEGETTVGYLLVQQALGHLAHDSSMTGIEVALQNVGDALAASDQEGVDLAQLEQAKAALKAGQVGRARVLLQESIQGAVADLPAATGEQTGTRVVAAELQGRPDMRGQDWALLVVSVLALVSGTWLALVFRPHDTVKKMRIQLATEAAAGSDGTGRRGTRQ